MSRIHKLYIAVRERVACLRKEVEGQAMTEYALILALIAVAAYIAYQTLGTNIKSMVQSLASDI